MIQRYLCLPVLLTAVFCMGAPVRAQQGSPPQHAQNQRALSTPDSASRSVVAGGTPSVRFVEGFQLQHELTFQKIDGNRAMFNGDLALKATEIQPASVRAVSGLGAV